MKQTKKISHQPKIITIKDQLIINSDKDNNNLIKINT